jgi:hypothetical protein
VPNFHKQLFLNAIFDHDFQEGTLWVTFSPKQSNKKEVVPMARAVLQATLLFTKP